MNPSFFVQLSLGHYCKSRVEEKQRPTSNLRVVGHAAFDSVWLRDPAIQSPTYSVHHPPSSNRIHGFHNAVTFIWTAREVTVSSTQFPFLAR